MKLILAVITLTVFVTSMPTCHSQGGHRTPRHFYGDCPLVPCQNINPLCMTADDLCLYAPCENAVNRHNCLRHHMGESTNYTETERYACLNVRLGSTGNCSRADYNHY